MKKLFGTNLRYGWKSYGSPSWFYYRRYFFCNHAYHISGQDCLLFIGPLQFRWWKQMDYTISRPRYFTAEETYNKLLNSLPSNLHTLAPHFYEYLEVITPKEPVRKPFSRIHQESLWVELTVTGYQRLEQLSSPHAATLLAIWLVQHGK